jgi:hypothetical protein
MPDDPVIVFFGYLFVILPHRIEPGEIWTASQQKGKSDDHERGD